MTMNVLFDHQMFVAQALGGASRYFVELARALNELPEVQAQLFAPAHVNHYLDRRTELHPWSFRSDWPARALHLRVPAVQPLLRLAMALSPPDVLHETSYGQFQQRVPSKTRVVTTVHDMAFERFPHLFDDPQGRAASKLAALRRAHAIVCISEHTWRELLAIYPEFAERCAVVPHGVTHTPAQGERPAELPEQYMLYVGTRHSYKNFDNLLRALGAARGLPADLVLVCFGGGQFSPAELQLCAQVGWPQTHLRHLAGNDDLLSQAYKHASFFVFPSSYEGFGMPLTEAMVQGCPVVCSRASSFPEVCGAAAAYFDPSQPADMARCIEQLATEPERRRSLGQEGLRHVKSYTWQRCAEQTLAIYQQTHATARMATR
jgi:glycosyltransferase involved in cell wall biosynthesis